MSRNTEKPVSPEIESIPSTDLVNLWNRIEKHVSISQETLISLQEFILKKEKEQLSTNIGNVLQDFKDHINNSDYKEKQELLDLAENDFSILYENIVWTTKEHIVSLKNDLVWKPHEEIYSSNPEYTWLNHDRVCRALHPEKPHHYLDAAIVGTQCSLLQISKVWLQVCKDTVKFPYDCYQIISWKATTNAFRDT